MPTLWKTLLPLALTLVLTGFVAGAVVAGHRDEPPRRAPVEMTPGAGVSSGTSSEGSPSQRPSQPPTDTHRPSSDVTVISPRPTMRHDDDDDHDDRGERDDDDDGADDD